MRFICTELGVARCSPSLSNPGPFRKGYVRVCVYYCSTYYKTVRVEGGQCVFITAVPIANLFAWGGGGGAVT
jgi:hypothetical protein